MATPVQKIMLPLSVCGTLFGLYTIDVMKRIIKEFLLTYCWVLTMLFFIIWVVHTVDKLNNMEFSFISVTYELAEILHIVSIIYYNVKYITHIDGILDVYKNIDYIDECFECIGIKVPYRRQQLQCVTFSVFIIFMWIMYTYFSTRKEQMQVRSVLFSEMYSA